MRSLLQAAAYGPASEITRHWASMYRWISVSGGFVAFALACLTGANDVASSFGTSVGSGAVSMGQAVILASITETVGTIVLGYREVKLMPFYEILKEIPPDAGLFMWGLFISMIAAILCLTLATYMEVPISASLALLGGIIGMAFSTRGLNSIYWTKDGQESLLSVGGLCGVILSWIVAPSIAAGSSFIFFGMTKKILLRSDKAERRMVQVMPLYYGMTVMVLIYFVIYKGSPRYSLHDWSVGRASFIAGLSGLLASFLAFVIVVPLVRKKIFYTQKKAEESAQPVAVSVDTDKNEKPTEVEVQQQEHEVTADDLIKQFNHLRVLETVYEEEEGDSESPEFSVKCSPVCAPSRISFGQLLARTPNRHRTFKRIRRPRKLTAREKVWKYLKDIKLSTFGHKISYDREVLVCHALAEKFDENVEELFSFLQVLTACVASLSHGSNDVAALMGPYSAILQIYKHSTDLPSRNTQVWVLTISGIGVSLGFALWGWKLVRCLGGRLTFLTPSRGFSAQLCAVATTVVASQIKLPVSTTHIVIGAIVGVGAADNIKNVNWKLLLGFTGAWVATIVGTCALCAAIYSFTIFSPSYAVG